MKRFTMPTRIALLVLAALLALPMAETASPAIAKPRTVAFHREFANTTPINLPISAAKPASGSLYPSTISVSGVKGKIREIDVVLHDIGHTFPDEIEVLLVAPNGQRSIVIANVGGSDDITGARLRLASELTEPVPDQVTLFSGNWAPTNATGNAIAFNAPAPPVATANASFSVFLGTNPNGTWQLFVQDENGPTDPGAIAGGWELHLDTVAKIKKKRKR